MATNQQASSSSPGWASSTPGSGAGAGRDRWYSGVDRMFGNPDHHWSRQRPELLGKSEDLLAINLFCGGARKSDAAPGTVHSHYIAWGWCTGVRERAFSWHSLLFSDAAAHYLPGFDLDLGSPLVGHCLQCRRRCKCAGVGSAEDDLGLQSTNATGAAF